MNDNKNGVFEKSTTKSLEISRNTLSRMTAHNVVPLTEEERKEIMKAYDDVKRCCAL